MQEEWVWERDRLYCCISSVMDAESSVPWSCVQRLGDGAQQDLGEGREES